MVDQLLTGCPGGPGAVADQAVVGHHTGVKIDLDLGIQRNHLQGGGQIIHKEFTGLI